mmetsp:Transcript_30702/g.65250  ORF Transcript_30702/g.65250 Transcript_30702/m.65250 type:complete len:234 (+) Transcript_30702:560-1261(+)
MLGSSAATLFTPSSTTSNVDESANVETHVMFKTGDSAPSSYSLDAYCATPPPTSAKIRILSISPHVNAEETSTLCHSPALIRWRGAVCGVSTMPSLLGAVFHVTVFSFQEDFDVVTKTPRCRDSTKEYRKIVTLVIMGVTSSAPPFPHTKSSAAEVRNCNKVSCGPAPLSAPLMITDGVFPKRLSGKSGMITASPQAGIVITVSMLYDSPPSSLRPLTLAVLPENDRISDIPE